MTGVQTCALPISSASGFDPLVKEQALYNYALCIHETSYSPFAESVTVFERFLNEFPNSPYAEQIGRASCRERV